MAAAPIVIVSGGGLHPNHCGGAAPALVNTGNVEITARFMDGDTNGVWDTSESVAPGSRVTVPFPPAGGWVYVEIDGDNTVAVHNKCQIGNNGNMYFILRQDG